MFSGAILTHIPDKIVMDEYPHFDVCRDFFIMKLLYNNNNEYFIDNTEVNTNLCIIQIKMGLH